MWTCPTVRIVSQESPGGFKVINESDLTTEDEIWIEPNAAAESSRLAPSESQDAARRRHRSNVGITTK